MEVESDTCESCQGPLGDDAPLYDDADICLKCHKELTDADEGACTACGCDEY